jgi:hypothetical protein
MDQFKTTNVGGLPAVLDDLRFVDESIRNVFTGLMAYLGKDPIYLGPYKKSAEFSTAVDVILPATVESFAVMIDEEIWFVPSQALPLAESGKQLNIRKSSTFTGTAPGLKTFESGSVFETYNVRVGEIYKTDSIPAGEVRFAIYAGSSQWKFAANEADIYTKLKDFLNLPEYISEIISLKNRVDALENP